MLTATFYGVRGSTPCSCDDTRRYGGNTSCVYVEVADGDPLILDLGTGLRYLGLDLLRRLEAGELSTPFRATALVSHLHWDHIQGTPFFKPLLRPGSSLRILGPPQDGSSVEAEFAASIRPPVFPVAIDQLPGAIEFDDVDDVEIKIGATTVRAFPVPHVGPTNGYRIDDGDGSLAYLSDHQQPPDGGVEPPANVVEACAGVDILVHDAQYSPDEFAERADWGHCTPWFALELALRCEAKRLVLFHHDPTHDDEWVSAWVDKVQAKAGDRCEVLGAAEGLSLVSGQAVD